MNNNLDVKKIIKIGFLFIFFYWILQNITIVLGFAGNIFSILKPFVIGACLAFIINIPMKFFESKIKKEDRHAKKKSFRNKIARPIALILSILIIGLVFSALFGIVLPEIFNVIKIFIEYLPEAFNNVKTFAVETTEKFPEISEQIKKIDIDTEKLTKDAITLVTNISSNVLVSSVKIVSNTVSFVVNAVISIVFSIYILFSKETLGVQAKKLVYAHLDTEKASYIIEITGLSNKVFNNFIKGQLTEALILGSLTIIGMLILQIPYALAIGLLIAFTSVIPVVGAFIGIAVGVVLILAANPVKALVFLVFILILQQFENNVIYPKVVGESVGLPGIWVLLSVTVGGSLLGAVGMIVALPIVSILYTLIKDETNRKLEKKKITINENK